MPTLGSPITQQQWSTLMVQQLQALDPAISAQVGTPERKIIDTLAYALANAQIDLNALQNSLSVDGKIGYDLDRFVGLFGFSRQQGSYATGTVTFSAGSPTTFAIGIPFNTQVAAVTGTNSQVVFDTIQNAVIPAGGTSVDVPVRAEVTGQTGDVDANTITLLAGSNTIAGVTSVTNAAATTGGSNQESDAALKIRFKNQVFRNVSGTTDQFLAIGLSGIYSTKANCLGPLSRYREYLQCPALDDSLSINTDNGHGFAIPVVGNGDPNQFSTGVSNNPYSQYLYTQVPSFVSNGSLDSTAIFYQPGIDWVLNTTAFAKDRGDAYRSYEAESTYTVANPMNSVTVEIGPGAGSLSSGTYDYLVTAFTTTESGSYGETDNYDLDFDDTEITITVGSTVQVNWTLSDEANGYNIYRYNTGTSECAYIGTIYAYQNQNYFIDDGTIPATSYPVNPATGNAFPPTINTATVPFSAINPSTTPFQPSVTFLNVYTGADATVQAVRPGDVTLLEYSYISTESRNDFNRNVTNCVDLYVDGQNPTSATTTSGIPEVGVNLFTINPSQMLYLENYRRIGNPEQRPVLGNFLQPLFYTPLIDVPSSITIGTDTYYQGVHYYATQEVDQIGSTIRARDGLEWNPTVPGQANGDPVEGPYTGAIITSNAAATMTIPGYDYDKNIVDLQSACEGVKQATTDVLVHSAVTRYMKLDVTVVYSPGSNPNTVNSAIQTAVSNYLQSQYFGAIIQMSTLINVIYNTNGVSNVRWTAEVDDTKPRVQYTDVQGNPLTSIIFDRFTAGNGSAQEVQQAYIVGNPSGGTFTLSFGGATTATIPWVSIAYSPAELFTLITNALLAIGVTVTPTIPGSMPGTPEHPILLTFSGTGFQTSVISCNSNLVGTEFTQNNDFYLKDSELPALPTGTVTGDSVPGLIIRQRAQDTWSS